MTVATTISVAAVWVVVAVVTKRDAPFGRTRRRFTVVLAVSTLVCALSWLSTRLGLWSDASGPVHPGIASVLAASPFVMSLMGVVVFGLSDRISHSVGSLRRILLLLANAQLFFVSTHPAVLALSWAVAPCIVWFELRSMGARRGTIRVFLLYQGVSVAAFSIAAAWMGTGAGLVAVLAAIVAIGIREAVIPGHSWLVRLAEDAPMGVLVAFSAPQLGVHAHALLLGGVELSGFQDTVTLFGGTTAVLAAALGIVQTRPRRALAYLLMSQTGLVAIGIGRSSVIGQTGGLVYWQVLMLALAGFAMMVSAIESRRAGLSLGTFSGCFARTPRMAAGFLTMGLASAGFPMTLGFVAEDLLVQGTTGDQPILGFLLIVTTALNGMVVLRFFFHVFSGQREDAGVLDLTNREAWALSSVLLALMVGGIAPRLVLPSPAERVEHAIGQELHGAVGPGTRLPPDRPARLAVDAVGDSDLEPARS